MLKRLVLSLVVLVGVHAVLRAQPVPASPVPTLSAVPAPATPVGPVVGPRIQFAELTHDFGKVEAGSVVKHEFIFTNTGTATLEITDVRPGCGCTTAGTWDRKVEPGQTGRVPLQLNTTGFSGAVAKSATVTCNATSQNNLYLQLKATIWRPVEVNPPSAYFNVSAETATNQSRSIRILSNLEAPLTLSPPECTNTSFRAELKTIREGREFELLVTVQPPFAANYAQSPVTLKTSSTNVPLISVPVYAHVQPVIMTVPSLFNLPPGPLTAPVSPSLTIRNTGTNALVLSEPTINLDGATLALREMQTGRVYTLTLSVPAGLQLQPTQRVEVSLKSNHPRFPIVKVPVIQQQRVVTPPISRPAPAATTRPALPATPAAPRPAVARPAPLPPPVPK